MAELATLAPGFSGRLAQGTGDGVFWVHGYSLDASSWQDLWSLMPEWRHIGIDLPGHGASRPLVDGDDLPTLARELGRIALAQDARHLVALSFGTIIALQIAMEFPGAFRSIVLGAPALAGGPEDPEAQRVYEALAELFQRRGPGSHLVSVWMDEPSPIFRGLDRHSDLWRSLEALVGRHRWSELESNAMHHLTGQPQTERALRSIRTPLLILLGDDEMPAFKRCAEIIHRAAPATERVYLPDIGHLCMLQAPQRCAALIDAHLRANGTQVPAPLSR